MKWYALIGAACYVLLLLIPLPLLPSSAGTVNIGEPSTSAAETDEPAETIKILDASAGVIYTFEERDFIIYTVAAEMPALYEPEALKAQAVATYTYYMYEKSRNADKAELQGADTTQVPDTFPASYSPEGLREKWGDKYATHLTTIAQAVDSVLGQQILYEGQPILAVYHAANWGKTETAGVVWGSEYPYLQSVDSAGDAAHEDCTSAVTVGDKAFSAAFGGLEGEAATWITGEITRSPAGSVTAITVGGKTYTGREVREKLGLRSACFTVTHGEEEFTFEVRGYGHGVGLSQVGANALAKEGYTYKEILEHYYTGVTVE